MIKYGGSENPNSSERETNIDRRTILSRPRNQPAPEKLKVAQKDLLIFFRQLSVILESGVALAQGMILIVENMTMPNLLIASKRLHFS